MKPSIFQLKLITVAVMTVLCSIPFLAYTQQAKKITGRVTTETGDPLTGVSIQVKNTQRGTTSGDSGRYEIEVTGKDPVLIFSYVGYVKQELRVAGSGAMDVVLVLEKNELSQVVVIGYGTIKKSDITGSVASVKADELKAIPATSFDQALQGRAAGVQVTTLSGKPGAETSIRIRGTTSINAGNEPLYVIDGMLITSDGNDMSTGVTLGPRIGPLASINPNDIESIEILKDASATAIYGSRGANGVVLITTKRGRKGKGTVTLDSYYGSQTIANQVEVLNAADFANLVNDAKLNANQTPIYVNPKNLGEGTNWQDEVLQTAPMGNLQLTFAGGDDKTKYSIAGSYFKQEGIIIGSDFERFSFRANFDRDISDRLSIGTSLTYSGIASNGVLTNAGTIVPGVITSAFLFNPVLPVYDSTVDGGYTYQNDRGKVLGNPVAEAEKHISYTTSSRFLGNFHAKYKLMEGLEFKTSFGVDAFSQKENSYAPYYLKRAEASKGEAAVGDIQGITWLNENTFTYNKKFRNEHALTALAGFTMQQFQNQSLLAYAFDFPDDRTGYHNLGAALNPQKPVNNESKWSLVSFLGRAFYNIQDKYLVTLTARADGSSKFAEGNKFGFFPSGAVAWRMSKERFMQDVDFISDLKLRVSYGAIGNQAIPPYQSLSLVGPYGQGVFNSSQGSEPYNGMEPLSYVNKDLKWETTKQLDIGIDLSMFKNRITIAADYYHKKTFDLLLSTPIPTTSGFTTTLLNVGNIVNRGFDFDIRTINTTGTVKWNTSLNISVNRNELTDLNTETDIPIFGGLILREGESIGTFYGYIFDGIFQSDEEAANSPVLAGQEPTSPNPASRAKAGDRKYRDINNDGKIDAADRTLLGTAQPDFTWGLNNTISYGNWDFSFFFQGSQGNKLANYNSFDLLNFTGQNNVLAEAGLNRWTPERPSNKYPRALASGSLDVGIFSSAIVEDASYIRLKNVTLAYRMPYSVLKKTGIQNMKIYGGATNLWTRTNYTGYDPEANTYGQSTTLIGIDFGGYPQTTTYTIGLNIGF